MPRYQSIRQSSGSSAASASRCVTAASGSPAASSALASARSSSVPGCATAAARRRTSSRLAVPSWAAAGSAGSTSGTGRVAATFAGSGRPGRAASSRSAANVPRGAENTVDIAGRACPSSMDSTSRSTPASWSAISSAETNRRRGPGRSRAAAAGRTTRTGRAAGCVDGQLGGLDVARLVAHEPEGQHRQGAADRVDVGGDRRPIGGDLRRLVADGAVDRALVVVDRG